MHSRLLLVCSLLAGCPASEDATDTTGATQTGAMGMTGAAPTTGTSAEDPTTGTTGDPDALCIGGGIGPAFQWATAPGPGVAECTLITDSALAFDCSGDFVGIFTLELVNTGALGLSVGDVVEIDYRIAETGESITGEWLRVRGQNQWWIVAGQGSTLAPPDAPADWFHPNVEVAVVDGCEPVACDGSSDVSTPRSISFGEGDIVVALAPGKDGGVPGEFGGERYHAAVSEAHTGVCGGGPASAGLDVLAFSVVSSGLL